MRTNITVPSILFVFLVKHYTKAVPADFVSPLSYKPVIGLEMLFVRLKVRFSLFSNIFSFFHIGQSSITLKDTFFSAFSHQFFNSFYFFFNLPLKMPFSYLLSPAYFSLPFYLNSSKVIFLF